MMDEWNGRGACLVDTKMQWVGEQVEKKKKKMIKLQVLDQVADAAVTFSHSSSLRDEQNGYEQVNNVEEQPV